MARKNKADLSGAINSVFSSAEMKPEAPQDGGILSDISKEERNGERVKLILRGELEPSKKNKDIYNVDDLETLAADIARRGIQEPLIVRQKPNGKFAIRAGERRYAANAIAVDKMGYSDGEYLPVIVRNNITDEIEEREAIILDNLQRVKTDYTRMMEIIELINCAEARKERGEKIASVRNYVMERLGVSQSEITRFERIHKSLIPELLQEFRNERFATNVAHTIATGASEDAQKYIYENWDWGRIDDGEKPVMLTYPDVEKLQNAYLKSGQSEKEAEKKKKEIYKFSSRDESITTLDTSFTRLSERLKDAGLRKAEGKLKKADQKKIMSRASKLYAELISLQSDLDLLMGNVGEEK